MECVLRVYGQAFDVDQFLSGSPWNPSTVYRRGEKRQTRVRGPEHHRFSGFVLAVPGSDSPADAFSDQVAAVLAFLRENHPECARLASFPGIERRTLDFAVTLRDDQPMRSNHLPIELVRAAAELDTALEVTVYAVSAESDE
jgi:hypothetical protein